MERSLFHFIWRYSKKQQVVILFITVLSFPLLYSTLELPKMIVNDAIQGSNFPRVVFGYEMGQIQYLLALCFSFLFLVFLNNGVKYTLNVYKGLTGERMLRRLRYELFQRVLRFRLPQFRRVSSSEIIPMITSEVEDLGGYIGDAIAVPAFQGGTLLVYLFFIFVQNPLLGVAAIALYPVQGYIIPRLQRRVIMLSRERVRNVRTIADRVGESINGVTEIHANDTSAWHMADLSSRLHTNFTIRYEIFKRKYMIKFINNLINQLTPFFFYSIGGYLVIEGNISFGALVAVLAAYKDLAGPWKELLAYYQTQADCSVKYETVIENFDPPDIYPVERLTSDEVVALGGALSMVSVSFSEGGGRPEAHGVSLDLPQGAHCAIVGDDRSGRSEVLLLASGLLQADSGRVEIGGRNIETLAAASLGRLISYVTSGAHIFTGTIRDNLYYGLRHRPVTVADAVQGGDQERAYRRLEAIATANSPYEIDDEWEDFSATGAESQQELDERAVGILKLVGLDDDIYHMGLQARIAGDEAQAMGMLDLRAAIAERLTSDKKLGDLIEPWEASTFNPSASLAENLLFGLPADPSVSLEQIPEDELFLEFLKSSGLHAPIVDIGRKIAETMVELFGNLSAQSGLQESFSFVSADQMPDVERILRKGAGGDKELNDGDAGLLIGIALKLIPAKHRLGIMTPEVLAEIVAGRKKFREQVGTGNGRYVLFDREAWAEPLSIEDNLIFGKPRGDRRDARERIEGLIGALIDEMELRAPILEAGLDYNVGVAGSRLTNSQRQKMALARALVKNPQVLVIDGVAAGSGAHDRALREALFDAMKGRTVLFGLDDPQVAQEFPYRAAISQGHMEEPVTSDAPASSQLMEGGAS
ncbi:ABC transporter ATP-binding protein/permease [Breoghania sp.]|uniref:ABC transporter ATP-binding protein/permease n=1 Tax=Breoghania sp. TaxID=2065378 RepID=UPI002AA6010E|nr:ABC transporter ATP-binding protein/permease [Breoghania sp.]